jgi:hypothetical protein
MVDDLLVSETFFQTFRVPDEKEPVRIPVVIHPTLNELYILWSDITDCFPKAARIQFQDIYIPKLRDASLYRYFFFSRSDGVCQNSAYVT